MALFRTLPSRLRLRTLCHSAKIHSAFAPALRIGAPSSLWTLKSFSTASLGGKPTLDSREEARLFPVSGFETIEAEEAVEEEELPDYRAHRFYPVHLGDVFHDRYQVTAKLGFGSSSTIWLARDLKEHQYVTLKIYVHTSLVHRELPFYDHLTRRMQGSSHRGLGNMRSLLDSFELTGPDGKHISLVLGVAQMSLRDMKSVFLPDGFEESFVKSTIVELLYALDFLHTHGEVVHTDVHPGNLLLGVNDNNIMQRLEENEFASPVPRKPVSSSRTIYLSRMIRPEAGPMLLSDFGEARIGPGPHRGDIMPLKYRAPEALLHVGWSYPVDIWSVGLTAWDLLGRKRLFTARDEDGDAYDAAHFAQLIAALGPPPPEFLAKNTKRKLAFWDEQDNWLDFAPIPTERTLEALETQLQDKSGFLKFLRRALTWLPEKRATARELLADPWLIGEKD